MVLSETVIPHAQVIYFCGTLFEVYPMSDGSYCVASTAGRLAYLYPESTASGIRWESGDWENDTYWAGFGQLIAEKFHIHKSLLIE